MHVSFGHLNRPKSKFWIVTHRAKPIRFVRIRNAGLNETGVQANNNPQSTSNNRVFVFCVCSHLWVFVSNFTEFDAVRLYKLYRNAVKKREDNENASNAQAQNVDSSSQSSAPAKKRPHEDGKHSEAHASVKRLHVDNHSDNSRDASSSRDR